ncbi:MAG: cobalt-precorrin-5B (C(1))-methyltransferase [Nitrospirae bacterium]|nr:cobalt-precorrin-5B (C(1))-methyltransferase [Nitrospirota bacterium]
MQSVREKTMPKAKATAELRSGFTTGACATAAAKAAAYALINEHGVDKVEISLPAGPRAVFDVHHLEFTDDWAQATVIKDAGDDPDVTNGAEIGAVVKFYTKGYGIVVKGGRGVGKVTKPGLAIPVGHAAINPVPLKMLKDELAKVLKETDCPLGLEVTVFVPRGEEISKKTLNERLGIVGGISILGTTGIVEPISTRAWTDTVVAAMSVARACGVSEIILTPGRTSEAAAMKMFPDMPEEAFIQMGDHVGFALAEARKRLFTKVIIVGQFGKLVKMAMGSVKTNVKDSTLELGFLADVAEESGWSRKKVEAVKHANTAREVFMDIASPAERRALSGVICGKVSDTARNILGARMEFTCMMVDYEGKPV